MDEKKEGKLILTHGHIYGGVSGYKPPPNESIPVTRD